MIDKRCKHLSIQPALEGCFRYVRFMHGVPGTYARSDYTCEYA